MDGRTIKIKRIGGVELDAFRRIRLEALRSDPAYFASTYDDWASLTAEEWRQRLNDPVFVAFQNGEPVGLIGLLRERPSRMMHRATIIMVYVREDLRGSGLAKNLLSSITDYARNNGIMQLELGVNAENAAAMRFYQREGFKEVGRIPGGFLDQGMEIDNVLMVRRLVR